jgi:5-methyltetrahydrofolate--homocysteine methyltransferase
LLKCVEDVSFDTDSQATERLIEKASEIAVLADNGTLAGSKGHESVDNNKSSLEERLHNALIKGQTLTLETDMQEAMEKYGSALSIIEGPLMAGMETVGKLFGDGKMFLPQVVKSAKVMRDAVKILEPYLGADDRKSNRPKVVIATVKGDVHDIGKNITAIVLACNGFDVKDLGVMIDKETILEQAVKEQADIIAVSGLITPSLYQMEELCKAMSEAEMSIPLLIGGATTSAVHTAVKLAPLYKHVFYGADASAAAVLAKKCIIDRETFENEQHAEQEKLRALYHKSAETTVWKIKTEGFSKETYTTALPENIEYMELPIEEALPWFDWKMLHAIWGVRYGSPVPEVAELMQLRRDAEDELAMANFKIHIAAHFYNAYSENGNIVIKTDRGERHIPMLREESGKMLSLSDFVIPAGKEKTSAFGVFAISVKPNDAHEEGCCCPACSNKYEDLVGRTVRMTVAEAASCWLDNRLKNYHNDANAKIIKPAAGYASCPDHTLKKDIMELLPHGHRLGIKLTESYAMIPESSICGMIFIHPDASYPSIRRISQKQYDDYVQRRGMSAEDARRFLGHLLK